MMKSVQMLVAAILVGVSTLPVDAEIMYDWTSSGSYSVGKTATVRMPEDGEVYYKLSGVRTGGSCTFVATGSGAEIEVVYTYKEDGDTMDFTLAMGDYDLKTANQCRCIVDYECWVDNYIVIEDPEDKENQVKPTGYYLHVMGDEGETITLWSSTGVVPEPIPIGDIDNPKTISPTSVPQAYKANFVEGEYYFNMDAKVGTYLLATAGGTDEIPLSLSVDTNSANYKVEDVSARVVEEGNRGYLLKVTKSGQIDFVVSGLGDSFGLTYQYATEGTLGRVTVNTKGTAAKWSIKGASGSYESGETVAILGKQTIVFSRVTGFSTPEDQEATPTEAEPDVEILGVYNDTFDPKDDEVSGATKITPSAKGITAARTLFIEDTYDHFAFSAKDGVYYNFTLADLVGDAVMTIFNKNDASETTLAGPDVRIDKLVLDKGDYIIRVAHSNESENVDAQYTLRASSANVGAIKFAKTAVSVKKTAGVVKLTVNRTAKEGRVRARYGTVAGTAEPGKRYVAQNGILEWADGDSKAKSIEIKLIPDLVAVYDAENPTTEFTVLLKAMDEEEIVDEDEYPAQITEDTCMVTITESASKSVNSIEKAYAKTVAKVATVKTEDVALRSGTFYGVLTEDGSALTNGLPQLASVTLTTKVSAGKDDTLSAKVALAGKTYTFKTDTKNPAGWENLGDGRMRITLKLVQKVDKVSYTNELTLTVRDGQTTDAEGWLGAGGTAELVMNVPDAKGKGVQEEIHYLGDIYRQNAKIQDYLNVVTNFFGYYTVALAPEGVSSMDGIPAGNGYLTVKVDNKGTAKVAGILADGTKVSVSVTAAAICKDETSAFGYSMHLPVFVAKSPYCFGGTLRLYAKPGKTLPNKDYEIVVDSTTALVWNNDNAKLTYYNEDGWRILCDPVGGWYDTVMNLQAYYLNYAFEVGGADITEFPTELVASGYQVVTDVQPNGLPVNLANNVFSTAKKSLVKDGKLYDLLSSVNPCNVQVKLARATGLVTGSFSIWSEDEDGLKQKEITGFKHNGVLLLSRDEYSPISEDMISAGFSLKTGVKLTDENQDTGKKTTRSWNLSLPFNLLGIDQGDVDWWADDWGWNPEWGEEPAE